MDAILMSMKGLVEEAVWGDNRIPSNRKDVATEVCMKAVANSFKEYFASVDNFGFSIISDLGGDLMLNKIINRVRGELAVKIGLSADVEGFASSIALYVISSMAKKINTQEETEFTIDGLAYIFSGKHLAANIN